MKWVIQLNSDSTCWKVNWLSIMKDFTACCYDRKYMSREILLPCKQRHHNHSNYGVLDFWTSWINGYDLCYIIHLYNILLNCNISTHVNGESVLIQDTNITYIMIVYEQPSVYNNIPYTYWLLQVCVCDTSLFIHSYMILLVTSYSLIVEYSITCKLSNVVVYVHWK